MPPPHFTKCQPLAVWSTHLSVRLPRGEKTRLEQLARQHGRSVSELLRNAIRTLIANEGEAAAMNAKSGENQFGAMQSPRAPSPSPEYLDHAGGDEGRARGADAD